VRLYESHGGRARAVLSTGTPVTSVTETDLLERPLADAEARELTSDGSVELALRPFQILTLRLGRDRSEGGEGTETAGQ
jgi:alpha-mannosidase